MKSSNTKRFGYVEAERPSVEIDRAGLVENADHDVDRFCHRLRLPCCQESAGNPHITLWHLPLTAFGPERFDEGEVTLLRALWSTQKQQNFRSTLLCRALHSRRACHSTRETGGQSILEWESRSRTCQLLHHMQRGPHIDEIELHALDSDLLSFRQITIDRL